MPWTVCFYVWNLHVSPKSIVCMHEKYIIHIKVTCLCASALLFTERCCFHSWKCNFSWKSTTFMHETCTFHTKPMFSMHEITTFLTHPKSAHAAQTTLKTCPHPRPNARRDEISRSGEPLTPTIIPASADRSEVWFGDVFNTRSTFLFKHFGIS